MREPRGLGPSDPLRQVAIRLSCVTDSLLMLHFHDECDKHVSLLAPEREPGPPPVSPPPARSTRHLPDLTRLQRWVGPPKQEFHRVTHPAPTPVHGSVGDGNPKPEVRRRRPWHLVVGLLAVLTVAGATTACSPEGFARMAIAEHWGLNAACAERIVNRESRFQADAVNPSSGTTGLFQIHPTHTKWIKKTFGYDFAEMKDPFKNAEVASALSAEAHRMYKDGWQPWRSGGKRIPGGGCPA